MQLLDIPEQTPSSEIDEEIIEIFVEEVEEVLEEIITNFNVWENDPDNFEPLKNLRRSFHTLKGSGRLVGATAIGELGWRFENMLNKVVNGTLSMNGNMLTLIKQVETVLPNMIQQFQHNQQTPYEILLLISQTDYLTQTQGQSLGEFEQPIEIAGVSQKEPSKPEAKPLQESEQPASEVFSVQPEPENEESEIHEVDTNEFLNQNELKLGEDIADENELVLEADSFENNDELLLETDFSEGEDLELDINNLNLPEEEFELEIGIFPENELELDVDSLSENDLEQEISNFPGNEFDLEDTEILSTNEIKQENPSIEKDILSIIPQDMSFLIEPEIDEEEISPELINIFKKEANQHIINLKHCLTNAEKDSQKYIQKDIRRAFHTLNGSSRCIDFSVISEIAAPMEDYANLLFEQQTELTPNMLAYFHEAISLIENLLNDRTIDETQQQQLLNNVQNSLKSLSEPQTTISQQDSTIPLSEEAIPEASDEFMLIFLDEASDILENTQSLLERWQISPDNMQLMKELQRELHTLKGGARMVGIAPMGDLSHSLESVLTRIVEGTAHSNYQLQEIVQTSVDELAAMSEAVRSGVPLDMPSDLIKQINTVLEMDKNLLNDKTSDTPPKQTTSQQESLTTTSLSEEASDEFMSIFLDEAEEILENTQSLLERWKISPDNMQLMKDLQRELHTLKGGARMVGITPMGDLSHSLESVLTRIVEGTVQNNHQLQEIVQTSVDELAAMSEIVRSGVPLSLPSDLMTQIKAVLMNEGIKERETTHTPTKPPSDSSTDDRIRVRATLIDKLTNLAGELSISRAHMEQQQGQVKNNLGEMGQTIVRLHDQLRRFEIETEAQIISHFGPQGGDNEEFDPLELDRFSTMQQLSKALLESINDLVDIQDDIKGLTRQSDTLLIQQSRIGAELQDNIMRTRMVPFSRISPRLQRIARLTARDLRKQVDFIINGEEIEFERMVLDRIVASLEHMLRNAIGHGIEDAPTRQQAGKSSIAKITIGLSREGAELVIKLSDDGAGLNLPVIRQKAEERGLIKSNTVISDYELMQFVLEPAFSTAKTVTQISGRGVGMDVANTEVKQLGGGLRIYSKMGEGTTFEIRLPLSLTITQALLVRIGEETMAIPINHIDAVMRAPRTEVISESNEACYYKYMDNNYPVFHLGELLGFGNTVSADMALIPTLLVRAANRRVALLIDYIEGSKEIVVKSVGPQISSIRWLAGATILGDGRVILILDVPSVTRVEETTTQYIPPEIPAVVIKKEEITIAKTVMVVDDSITVRKVTARLLKRQGMDVLTAKDGLDAVAQLQEYIPDLMLLDVEMPRMDGYELATYVRNTPDWKHIPIIMITSRTGTKHRDRAEKIGINRYLGKPFNENELLENINALLAETVTN
jgi:chemosensory pili system protein ChpA (sensor histidine kinase/response regulator)